MYVTLQLTDDPMRNSDQTLMRRTLLFSRTTWFALPLLVWALQCQGAGMPVEVAGISATQAILRYDPPNHRPCTVEASESNTFRPLVHDVDPALFEGVSDTR